MYENGASRTCPEGRRNSTRRPLHFPYKFLWARHYKSRFHRYLWQYYHNIINHARRGRRVVRKDCGTLQGMSPDAPHNSSQFLLAPLSTPVYTGVCGLFLKCVYINGCSPAVNESLQIAFFKKAAVRRTATIFEIEDFKNIGNRPRVQPVKPLFTIF